MLNVVLSNHFKKDLKIMHSTLRIKRSFRTAPAGHQEAPPHMKYFSLQKLYSTSLPSASSISFKAK